MKQKSLCDFNLLSEIENDENIKKTIEHISKCKECLAHIVDFENKLDKIKFSNFADTDLNQNFLDSNLDEIGKNWDNFSQAEINTLLNAHKYSNPRDFKIIPTPEYLKKIVENELTRNIESKLDRIIIKIQNKIELIGNYIDNLVINDNSLEFVPTRGNSGKKKETSGIIEFYQKINNKEIIQYHLIQDGPESILLTIKFENFSSEPAFLGLRSENKLISSKPLEKSYANFPKMGPGDYQIEASFEDKAPIYIPITIVG